jgi:hypothetical protein
MIALLDRNEPSAPKSAHRPGTSDEEDGDQILACARCQRPITTTAARIEVSGQDTFHGLIVDCLIEVREYGVILC